MKKNVDNTNSEISYKLPIKVIDNDESDTESDTETKPEIKEKSESIKNYIKTLQQKIKMMKFIKKIRQQQMDKKMKALKNTLENND